MLTMEVIGLMYQVLLKYPSVEPDACEIEIVLLIKDKGLDAVTILVLYAVSQLFCLTIVGKL